MKTTKMLKKNYEFKNVLSKGTYYSGKYIGAVIIKNKKNHNMLGIAVSVKTAKAVKRNSIKRLIRENYRLLESSIKSGYSIVILWKKKMPIENATFSNIQKDMNKIFDKADMLEEKS